MKFRIGGFLFGAFPVGFTGLVLMFLLLRPEWTQAAISPLESRLIASHLYEIQIDVVELEAFPTRGGAIEPLGEKLLVATPRGRLALIDSAGRVAYLPQRVPMNESASEGPILWTGFRVADILLQKREQNRYTLFASHHYFTGSCVEFRISSVSLLIDDSDASISGEWKTEFTAIPCIDNDIFDFGHRGGIQAGGRMLMDGPDHLLLVTGDQAYYEWYQEENPQEARPRIEEGSHLGKLLRIELANGAVETVGSGFRNPQGLARDVDGNLWQTEHGPQGGDELNLLKPGLDFGWPYVTHGIQYGNKVWPYNEVQGRHDGYEMPVYVWIPAIGISNLAVSDSRQFPLWQDDLLIASLITQSLYRARLHDGHVIYVEKIEIGARIRDITQLADGRFALLTDSAKVLFLQRAPIYCQSENDLDSIYSHDAEEVCIDLSRAIAASDDPLVRTLSNAHFDSSVIRSLYSIYIHENRLTYVKSPCVASDLEHRFFLHITPADAGNLVEETADFGFNVLDFNTDEDIIGSTIHENVCIVTRALPEFKLHHIYTGQVIRVEEPGGEVSWRGPVWTGSHTFSDAPDGEAETGDSPYQEAEAEVSTPGAELFAARCAACHNLAAEHNIGPHLGGVIGRAAGSVSGYNFTSAMSALDIVWTQENLAEYIVDPARFAPGTTMAGVGVTDEEALFIVEFLAANQ